MICKVFLRYDIIYICTYKREVLFLQKQLQLFRPQKNFKQVALRRVIGSNRVSNFYPFLWAHTPKGLQIFYKLR